MNKLRSANDIQKDWDTNPRWKNVKRDYTAEEVAKCSGSVRIEHTLARNGAEKLWNLWYVSSNRRGNADNSYCQSAPFIR